METVNGIKALFIIVNFGFADEAAEIARSEGATGMTVINARGVGSDHISIMGIAVDSEKEMLMCVADEDTAQKITTAIQGKAGMKTPANGFCFVMPVDQMIGRG